MTTKISGEYMCGGPPPPDDESESGDDDRSKSDDDGRAMNDDAGPDSSVIKADDVLACYYTASHKASDDSRYGMTMTREAPAKLASRRGARCSTRGGASKARGGVRPGRVHPTASAVSEDKAKRAAAWALAESFLEG